MKNNWGKLGFSILLLALCTSIYFFGVRIEIFIATAIFATIIYYTSLIKVERNIQTQKFVALYTKLAGSNASQEGFEYYKQSLRSRLSKSYAIVCILLVYIVGLFCVKAIQQPSNSTPYFNNINHSAISSSGVSFGNSLMLYNAAEDSIGMYSSKNGSCQAIANNTGITIKTNDFYKPFMAAVSPNEYSPKNNFFTTPLTNEVIIKNKTTSIQFLKVTQTLSGLKKMFGKKDYYYEIDFVFTTNDTSYLKPLNFESRFMDTFHYSGNINKGISFKQIFYNKNKLNANANGKVISAELANVFDDCSLLANNESNNSYLTFFPSKRFFEDGFGLYNNNALVAPSLNHSFDLANGQVFFVGLGQFRNKNHFSTIDKKAFNTNFEHALIFDYAPNKYFSSSIQNEKLGTIHQNFLVNHYKQLLNTTNNEGFLMHDALNANGNNFVNATVSFEAGAPNQKLNASIIDENNNFAKTDLDNQKTFSLLSQSKNSSWLYEVTDFSNNAYSLPKQFWYFTILALAFICTLLFNYNKNLRRIEPIIYIVWLALFIIRHILLWRVSTFPPVNHIGKNEFNTLLHFDTNLTKLFTIPSALAFSLLALVIINLGRFLNKRNFAFPNPLVKLDVRLSGINAKYFKRVYSYLGGKNKYIFMHLFILFVSLFVFKAIPVEILKRIFSILIPIASYFYFSKKIQNHPALYYYYPKLGNNNKFSNFIYQFVKYFIESPHFYLSLVTVFALGITDRGFGILFMLFLIIKNSVFSFMRNLALPNGLTLKALFTKPKYFYIYAILFFILYLILIGVKASFFYLLKYKFFIVMAFLLFIIIFQVVSKNIKLFKGKVIVGLALLVLLAFCIPKVHNYANSFANAQLRNVSYRASVLFQPIERLIESEDADSFEEDKIIATAQNQWFINSYINKPINYKEPINLRSHFNRGVDYVTQTRDLVFPRYLVAEFGAITVLLLLFILLLPLVYYLFSYALVKQTDQNKTQFISTNYASSSALMLFFTIALLVALTATNRFVFVGQDFPFLSLTSKMAVLLPLLFFVIVLLGNYKPRAIKNINFNTSLKRSGFFIIVIAIVLFVSGRANILNDDVFSVNLSDTKNSINNQLNIALAQVQDGNSVDYGATNTNADPTENEKYLDHLKLVAKQLSTNTSFVELYKNSNNYTKSILDILVKNPTLSLKNSSPIFMRFNNGKFEAEYNQNIYLELPAYEVNEQWGGNVYEDKQVKDSTKWNILVNNKSTLIDQMPAVIPLNGAGLMVLPRTWLSPNDSSSIILAALNNGSTNHDKTIIQVSKNSIKDFSSLNASTYAASMYFTDNALIKNNSEITQVTFSKNNGNYFMKNIWVNGKRRMIYPAGTDLFWMYHYANTASLAFKRANLLNQNTSITLDYNLQSNVQQYLYKTLPAQYNKVKNFKFSVIAADGLGNIKLMADYANNRSVLNPNDELAIKDLEQQHYFFSNRTNERDQWANSNLIKMIYGPGSSIKPIMFSAAASSGVLDWASMKLLSNDKISPPKYKEKKPAFYHYAGFNLKKKGWQEVDDGDNSNCDAPTYIAKSNNFYHSLVMFLGSYPKENFKDSMGNYSVKNILIPFRYDSTNYFPKMSYNAQTFLLPSYKANAWPKTNSESKTYFGNDKSILSKGLATQFNLRINDQDKNDFTIRSNNKVSFAEQLIYDTMQRKQIGSYLWSFPEESYFIQKERAFTDADANFNLGLKTPTSGGTPIEITPLKMVELYGRLFTQTNYNPKVTRVQQVSNLNVESDSLAYINFLKANVFSGMKQIFTNGTLQAFRTTLKMSGNNYRNYFLYAKTGTIKEANGKIDSKRLALIISKNDMNVTGPNNKVYVVFITAENIDDANYQVYKSILDSIIDSKSFENYMK